MNKLNRVLIGLLVVQLALVAICNSRDDVIAISKLEPLIGSFEADDIVAIQIFGPTSDPGNQD